MLFTFLTAGRLEELWRFSSNHFFCFLFVSPFFLTVSPVPSVTFSFSFFRMFPLSIFSFFSISSGNSILRTIEDLQREFKRLESRGKIREKKLEKILLEDDRSTQEICKKKKKNQNDKCERWVQDSLWIKDLGNANIYNN